MFYDVQFSNIDLEDMEEHFVPVLEQGGGKIIPEGHLKSGHLYTVGSSNGGMVGLVKIENQVLQKGSGKLDATGLVSNKSVKESVRTAHNYFKANSKQISASIFTDSLDFLMHIQDVQGVSVTSNVSLATLISLCSSALDKPIVPQLVVLGTMSIGGTIQKVDELANVLQVCFDSGAKKILLPMNAAADIPTVPSDLFSKFQISFYEDPEDAVIKALGIE